MKDIVMGLVAGVLGALLWAGVAAVTNYEVGWIAWIVGAMVGWAVARGNAARTRSPTAAGVLAVALTVLSIVGGKYLVVSLAMPSAEELIESVMVNFDEDEYVTSFLADDVAAELEAAGGTVDWPAGVTPAMASEEADYPAEVWAEATTRWAALDETERGEFRERKRTEVREQLEESAPHFRAQVFRSAFIGAFSPMDLIFFGLAIMTAWGLASGRKSKEQLAREFEAALKTTMLHTIACDGDVTDDEVAAVSVMHEKITGKGLEEAVIRGQVEAVRARREQLLASLMDLSEHLDDGRKDLLVKAATLVAVADGPMSETEVRFVTDVGGVLGYSGARVREIIAEVPVPSATDATD